MSGLRFNFNQFAQESLDTFTKRFNKPETVEQVGRNRTGIGLRYPLEESYPVYIEYRTREVVPPLFNATDQLNSLYQAHAPKEMAFVNNLTSSNRVVGDPRVEMSNQNELSTTPDSKTAKQIEEERRKFEARGGKEGLLGFKTQYTDPELVMKLYFPQALQMNDNVSYENVGLGISGAAGLQVANSAGNAGSAISAMVSETMSSLGSIFGYGNNVGSAAEGEAARVAAARFVSAISGVLTSGQQAAAGLALQVKVNPNTRSIFNGVNVRNFTFQYDFHPTSEREQQIVKDIIYHFRREMYPATIPPIGPQNSFPLGYKFPNLFEIKFRVKNRDIDMPQPLYCFLRDVSTSYNPNSMSFHEDGQAVNIQMSLAFQEFRALNKADIDGNGPDGVRH